MLSNTSKDLIKIQVHMHLNKYTDECPNGMIINVCLQKYGCWNNNYNI